VYGSNKSTTTQNNKDKKTNAVASALHNNTAAFAISYSNNEDLQHLYSLFNITVVFIWRRM
jgi:hypothetical protein